MLGVCLLLTVAVIAMVAQVRVQNDLSEKLPAGHPLRVAKDVVEKALDGSGQVEVIVDLGAPDAIKTPGTLAAVWRLQQAIEAAPDVSLTRSVGTILGRIHSIIAPAVAQAEPMPAGRTVSEYLLLFGSAGGAIDTLLDPSQQFLRITARSRNLSAEKALDLVARIEALGAEILPKTATVHVTGVGMLAARAGPVIVSNALMGLAGALVLIALLMSALFGSIRVGLLSVVPNLLPVAIGVAAVWACLPQVDADTLIYLTICVGIAVDDTIHFLARYRLERQRGLDREAATRATILEAGHGIVRTSIILVAGFSATLFSGYLGLQTLGLILPVTLIAAVILDLTMVPAMAQLGLLEPRIKARDA